MIAGPQRAGDDRGDHAPGGSPNLSWIVRQAVDPVGTSVVGGAVGFRRIASWAWDAARPAREVVERAQVAVADATDQLVRRTVRSVVEIALQEVDLTAVVRDNVDIEALIDTVDLDEVVALVDVDRIAARLDLEAILDRMSLTRIVLERVDLDAVVRAVDLDAHVARVDVNAVADRVDLDAAAGRLDVNAVARRVALDPLISTVDIEAIVDRLDLGDIAEDVIDQIDLAGLIRGSTGALSGEAVTTLRTQSRGADEAVAVFMRRLFSRSGSRDAPVGEPREEGPDGGSSPVKDTEADR
ncbi:hypothetical protein JL107_16770 [Nakamurella flavida]|uniref:Uncharacterized protein n=1 Tax=Nakamurella flavida TaxID=363630 RepID=A0A938YMQ7_9ACTN|nr:hypothetical protein [Nakamurella flavida]MBM9478104.1 hypothetical protein [Nakamurella flavida]MDP9778675.1 hypothetical protein [Nakamurella flavida]